MPGPTQPQTTQPELLFSRLRADEPWHIPTRSFPTDAGLDLYISTFTPVYPGTWARISHNLAMSPPPNKYGLIVPRSSTVANKGLIVLPGVIDSGYRGELMTVCYNPRRNVVLLNQGERISQLLLLPLYKIECREVPYSDLPQSERGVKGFGGSGA